MSNIRMHALAVATAVALTAIAAPASAGKVSTSGLEAGKTYDGFIVKYRKGSAERADVGQVKAALGRASKGKIAGKALALGHARRLGIGADLITSNRKLDTAEAEALMQLIAADPNVEYVHVNGRLHALMTPNDTSYNQQWGFSGANGIRAQTAWDRATGQGVVVAVLDTGITAHTDLDANILPGYDFVTAGDGIDPRDGDNRDANPRDEGDWYAAGECGGQPRAANSSFHGTHVAGTVAAVTNNASGVAGTAFNAKVVPVRVLAKCGGSFADIIDGITWASGGAVNGVPANANPAEVINMSLGGGGACPAALQDAINAAVGRGTTVVVAAGNDNADARNFTPAGCASVITVGSINSNGARSSFSNWGPAVDIAAPGGTIYSTVNTGATVPAAQGYTNMSGTSMASPHVAGVVALMQSVAADPKTPAQIEALITGNAAAFPANPDRAIGAGIVNANAAVNAVLGVEPPPPVGNALTKGVAKTGLSAATGAYAKFTMVVPAGASNLTFTMSGGTGDAD
ncbi:MAG TPA: S8 family peptidase, partial [Lysobacter sp.]